MKDRMAVKMIEAAEREGLMTHGSIPPEERARIGVTDELVRLSVGIKK